MKAARERLKGALTVNVTKPQDQPGKKKIMQVKDDDVNRKYKLGGQVMESTNTGMDVIFATRLSDGIEVVMKTRKKSTSFKSQREEADWRSTTEYQLNMPMVSTLCEFYEVLETRDMYYVVMEKVEGQDLFEQMAHEKLPHVDSREISKQILTALKVMHDDGRIHKDLKIENVMVDTNPVSPKGPPKFDPNESPASPVVAKLIDFDTVQDWEPSSPKAKDVLGTDGYIAPEAYSGEYSPASDIYAAGVITYKLITGKFPSNPGIFDDKPGENYVGSSAMKRIKEKLRLEEMNFKLSPLNKCPEVRELLQKMLTFEPQGRPSADECLANAWFRLDPSQLP